MIGSYQNDRSGFSDQICFYSDEMALKLVFFDLPVKRSNSDFE